MSPSICIVVDDEDDRNHISPSRVVLQLLNAELLQEIIRETDTENPPMCLSKVSETVKWRLMQPNGLRRSRLWASPVEMFEVAEEDGRRCPPQKLYPQPREKSPRAMLLCACLGWRRITATPRLEHQMFEDKGPLECRHIGAPRACIEIAYKPRTVAYPDVRADHSPFTFPD